LDIETFKVWLQGINMLGTFALGVWLYLEKRSDKTNERVTLLAKEVDELDKAVTGLQASTEAAPNHADIAKVYESINELAATVNQLVGENRGQSDTLRLILNQITQRGMNP
jgi:ABC-type transporter Mla subunit MlaD